MTDLVTSTLTSGGIAFRSVLLRCSVQMSKKNDEWIVTIHGVDDAVTPPTFFVDPILVSAASSPREGEQVEGQIQAILLEDQQGQLLVEIPGEPVSYGPKLLVPRAMAS